MKHYKHIFNALVNGEHIEYFHNGNWYSKEPHTALNLVNLGAAPEDFRIKPKTININGHEVPEPVREPLEDKQRYSYPDICDPELIVSANYFGDEHDQLLLSRGLIHLTSEAAEAHAKALLSFTQVKGY